MPTTRRPAPVRTPSAPPGNRGTRGVSSLRRLVVAVLFVGAASAALAAAGPDALVPFRDVAGAATEVSVAFVVDFGGSTGPVVACVKVPTGDNGYDALAAFTTQQQEVAPSYNSASLLCSIDGVPSSGCGQVTSDGYIYWSYWHGSSGAWAYASSGAFGSVQNGDVEGWRFEDPGKGNPGDPPPGSPPDYASICAPGPPPTTSTTLAVSPGNSGGPGVPSPGGAPSGSSSPVPVATSPPASQPGAPPATAANNGHSPTAGTVPTPKASTPAGAAPAAAGGSVPASPTASGSSGHHPQALGAAPAAADLRGAGGGSAVPLIIGGLLVVALLVAAVLGWRRRPQMP
jgi:hypothetical protein